ncbi:NAD-dependent epimerase/dehydratase family protein [Peribacillus cavernae]|uniref:NAD-dependent epimerase/dehydratase family protein n=1 Tax=Peribacillus cavernae TaxID=1674310 RepID=A0A3S0UGF4_9BACI|nr:NAD(P)H-binding protein [Peribacillus cavernae]MDQ0220630.1 uncharacterized protein YbjT (DUF2867 family) [Peribacillus cavernae]RUQ31091.1 NAD-dependent epimerase/dehydratase family protein [Peribacillus cavernae]
MNVLVFGAHGSVGEHVLKKLNQKNYKTMAIGSKENQLEDLKKDGATDAAVYDEQQNDSLLQNYEAVIFLTDINTKSDTDKTVLVDHRAVINAVENAEKQGVKRFILMSAVRANESSDGTKRNIGAKEIPDELLQKADVTYTVIRPSKLVDKPGQGTILLDAMINNDSAEIAREDVAAVLIEALENEATFNKTFDVSSGNVSIQQALSSL